MAIYDGEEKLGEFRVCKIGFNGIVFVEFRGVVLDKEKALEGASEGYSFSWRDYQEISDSVKYLWFT